MTINGKTITSKEFGFDECHKIYLINSAKDKKELTDLGYKLFDIASLRLVYQNSCPLKFISNADLKGKNIVDQCEEAKFEL